jgi:hypothetical protein
MNDLRLWIGAAACLLLAAAPSPGADPPPDSDGKDALALAAKIDEQIARHWADARVEPAPLADDAEYLRRVYLDIAGRIPSVYEARTFLEDKRPDKRQRLVDRLLDGPRYVAHFTSVWRALMLPEATASFQGRFLAPSFEAWLRKELSKNAGYDEMARELLTAPVGQGGFRGVQPGDATAPSVFYQAKEFKAENIAAATSRLFLGVKLECAQCHNHPFASWKREQFWSYAAFFSGIRGRQQGDFSVPDRETTDRTELTIPGTEKVVQAKFLDGKEPTWKPKTSPRVTLADWMTSADNPYFAKAAVNRLWFYFFGMGLVDPVDEMVGAEHTASHPELLDEMARQFAAHKFDLKFLMRAITASRGYQLTSAQTNPAQEDPHLFARMAIKGMTAEQLFDSLAEATRYEEGGRQLPPGVVVFGNDGSGRAEFLGKFTNSSDKPTEVQTSILQALTLMNGRVIANETNIGRSGALTAVAEAPFMTTEQKIETLFLMTLSRKPKPKELDRFVRYVEGGGTGSGADKETATKQALADVFWVLLNSSEFILNH